MQESISAGIIGGSGYTGGELLRLLINHPKVNIDFVYSTSKVGELVSSTHEDLLGQCDIKYCGEPNLNVDVLFLCLGHGNSRAFLEKYSFSDNTKIIDLGNDFRLSNDSNFDGKNFVYGLPELFRDEIKKTNYIANPGCFATAIQLALLPLADKKLLSDTVHINATTGSTGAGVKPSASSHFSWRNNNLSWYKPFTHQHLGEINQSISHLQNNEADILMLPQRGNFARGIFCTLYTRIDAELNELFDLYNNFYKDHSFVQVSTKEVHLKQVVNTNNCVLHLHKHNDVLLITSVIDNLIKGASGQAIQNMNLMFGFPEMEALHLKASYF